MVLPRIASAPVLPYLRRLRRVATLSLAPLAAIAAPFLAAQPQPAQPGQSVQPAQSAAIEQIGPDAITLDGKLTEALYSSGPWHSGFAIARSGDKAVNQTFFRLFSDGNKLYFVARMEKNGAAFHAPIKEHDSILLNGGDNISLFIRTNADASEYMQFQIAPNGTLADIRLQQGGVTREYTWNTDAEAACAIDPQTGDWTVEMSVPLAALQIDPAESVWHVNVGRMTLGQKASDGAPREANSWVPSPTEIDNAACLVPVQLPDFDRSVFGWHMHGAGTRVVLKGGEAYLATDVTLTNNTGSERSFQLHSQVEDTAQGLSAQAQQSAILSAGQSRTFEALTPLGAVREGTGLLRLTLTDAGSAEQWAVATGQITFAYTPAQLVLTQPGYRATIFASQQLKTLEAELVRVNTYATIGDISATLTLEDGSTLPATVTPAETAAADKWLITVNGIDTIADGKHQLQVNFTTKETDSDEPPAAQVLRRSVRKVPYQQGEMWIDATGVVYRDGKPFPAYGFHAGRRDTTGKIQALLPGMFYNTYIPVWSQPPFTRMKQTIDELASIGILSVVNVPSASTNGTRHNLADTLTPKERIEYRTLAIAARDNPHVTGYYMMDEPELTGHSPRRLKEIYAVISEVDPYHPIVVTNNTDEGVRNYQFGSDIINPDPYPIFLEGYGPARHFSRIATHISNVSLGQESYRALWVTPQAFDLTPFRAGETGYRTPTATEMRAQQTIALIHGAVGVSWYSEEFAWDEPSLASSLPYLSQEYLWLFPHITAARPQLLDTPTTVTAGLSADGEHAVLIVVNLETRVSEVALSHPLLASVNHWQQVGDSGTLQGGSETINLSLEPHQTVILASANTELPAQLSWPAVLTEEKRLFAAIQTTPDNIALTSNGAKTTSVGIRNWTAYTATNGIKEMRALGFYQPFFKEGMGLQIVFPEVKTPQRIVLTGSNILTGVIQAESATASGQWTDIARIDNTRTQDEQTFLLDPPPHTRALRIIAHTVAPLFIDGIRIIEVEVYEN